MKNSVRLLLLVMLFSAGTASILLAQHYIAVRSFTTSNGLSDNSALCALRDSYGMLWVGTENGLNYFDGSRIKAYYDVAGGTNADEANSVISIYEHNDGIWLGGTAGLYIMNRRDNTYHRFDRRTRYGVMISSAVSMAVCTRSAIFSLSFASERTIASEMGFVTGCRATKIVQQSSYGRIDVSKVPIFREISMISFLSKPISGR